MLITLLGYDCVFRFEFTYCIGCVVGCLPLVWFVVLLLGFCG